MSIPSPHYLLFSEACHNAQQGSAWRFVLESVDMERRFAATDVEPRAEGERLELLAVVRGLEAIEHPARVTLVTKSRYVSRGLKYGINDWRSGDWQWERFGKLVPVRDADLWRRVDRALDFHRVECRAWQFSESDDRIQVQPMPTDRLPTKSVPTFRRRHDKSRAASQAACTAQSPHVASPSAEWPSRHRSLRRILTHLRFPGLARLRSAIDACLPWHRVQPLT